MKRVETELLPCPFCGGTFVAQGASGGYISVWCGCGARGPEVKFPEICDPVPPIKECHARWNRRPIPAGSAEATRWKLTACHDTGGETWVDRAVDPQGEWVTFEDHQVALRAALSTAGVAEPVAWRYRGHFNGAALPWQMTDQKWLADRERKNGDEVEPLFASPPSDTEEKVL